MNKLICSIFLAAQFLVLTLWSLPAWSAEMFGLVMVAKGQVQVQKKQANTFEPLKVGGKVFPGDTVKTSTDSRAKIVMSDRNVLNLAPDTILVISKYVNNEESGSNEKKAELLMLQGKVRAKVEEKYEKENQGFQIKTPTAVAGVRGTDFLVNYNAQTRTTDVYVTGGVVAVAPLASTNAAAGAAPTRQSLEQATPDVKNEVPVGKNQTSTVSANTAPTPPRPFTSQEMNTIKSDLQESSAKTETKTEAKKEMVKKDMVGSGALKNDTQLNQEIKAPSAAPNTATVPAQVTPPPLPPKAPSNVSDIIQNQNKNSNVTIQPTK